MFKEIMLACVRTVGVVVATAGVSAFCGLFFWIAWNYAMPSLFKLPSLSYTQAWAMHYILNSLTTSLKRKDVEYSKAA